MSNSNNTNGKLNGSASPKEWKNWQKVLFRVAFVFFIIIAIPNNLRWYREVFSIDWTNLNYRDLYDIARFGSGVPWFGNTLFGSSLNGYAIWIITLLFSIGIALVWTLVLSVLKKQVHDYDTLYYWLRVVVRYRAAIGIIGFGFTKLFPVQMPYPSEALLNTDFGDFTAQKIYWLSIGIVPWYQVFAGIVENTAGALLFFRKTTLLGAVLLFGALGDIVYVNFAYDGGVHGYSSYFVLLSGFLIIQYIPYLYNLFIREKPTQLESYYPVLSKPWQISRYALKTVTIFVFVFLLFYLQYINFTYDPYKQPAIKGITALRGYYDVAEFKINGKEIPYSPTDTVRWQEATFEKWTTLTYKVNKPTPLDLSNGGGAPQRDINRTFEITGTAGGRRAFYYLADTIDNTLYLQDKYKAFDPSDFEGGGRNQNRQAKRKKKQKPKEGIYADTWITDAAWAHIGDEVNKINPIAASARRDKEFAANYHKFDDRKRMVLTYKTDDGKKVILKGVNETQDSIYVVLNKIDRRYALSRSTLDAGSY